MGILRNLIRSIGRTGPAAGVPAVAERLSAARAALLAGRLAAAEIACEECLSAEPDSADALHLLGLAAYRSRDWSRALACLLRSVQLDPANAEFLNNLGSLYTVIGHGDDAAAALRRALAIDPRLASARENLLFLLPFLDGARGEALRAEAETWARLHAPAAGPRPERRRDCGGRIRLGYVSADFRENAVSFFFEPVIGAHDRERFEIFCYSSDAQHDEFTARIRCAADHWREIADLDDERAVRLVREDRIDILVDLSGHLRGNRLGVFARRPAPLQMTWLGYLVTTGLAAIDYRITDAACDPPATSESHYTERLLRLPGCAWCYRPPADAPPVGSLPALSRGSVTFGSTNNPVKITTRMLGVWARVLGAVEGSRLLVAGIPEPGRARILQGLAAGGVGAQRVVFHDRLARKRFLALHGEIDVMLDTFPYNGGTTLCDALWMGVPAVSLVGDRMPARSAASLDAAVGLGSLAVRSEAAYVETALGLARELAGTAALRNTMRERLLASPLLDAAGFTRRLESLYGQALEQAHRGA